MVPRPADATWQRLITAHTAPRLTAEPEHRPVAAVLACSDARVPPSVLFDQPTGSLFTVRHAGNTARPGSVASLDYAVGHLGVDLVIVLGHTDCGAVAAALDDPSSDPVLDPVLEPIRPALAGVDRGRCDALDQAVSLNVAHTMAALAGDPGPTGSGIRAGHVSLRGAVQNLTSGALEILDTPDPVTNPTEKP